MNALKTILAILVFFILMVFLASVFIIQQGQQGILLRLGRLVNDAHTNQIKVLQPGLHVKLPFIESARVFDTRLQTLDIKSSRIVTREKKDVIVDYYVKWRITNLAHYFISTSGNEFKAETLLEQQLNTFLRAEFGKRTISDLVSGRDDVMNLLRQKAEQQAYGLGIGVVDVRVKGIELPPNTSNAVYQLMRADMQKIANRHRADGIAEAEAIQAAADAEVTISMAQAKSEGEIIRAQGQAQAAAIYNTSYSKNPEFFDFYRSLKAYEASLNNERTLLVLDQNSTFFDYFKRSLLKDNGVKPKEGL